jgi:hypothetical protein
MDAFRQPILSLWSEAGDRPRVAGDWASGLTRAAGVAESALDALDAVRREFPGRDALLLHADARLPTDGWAQLATAWATTDAAVLSPLDANDPTEPVRAPLPVWPGIDPSVPSDSWSPYCSLWRAEALAALPESLAGLSSPPNCRRLPGLRLEAFGAGLDERALAELAAQRDAALAQRDQAQAQLEEVLSTTSWRLTAPVRRTVEATRHLLHAARFRIGAFRALTGRGLTSLRVRGLHGSWVRFQQRRQSHGAEPWQRVLPDADRPLRAAHLVFPDVAAPRASLMHLCALSALIPCSASHGPKWPCGRRAFTLATRITIGIAVAVGLALAG